MMDINILVSMINMKLRDDDYSLSHVLDMQGRNEEEFLQLLEDNGFYYDPDQNQIKQK